MDELLAVGKDGRGRPNTVIQNAGARRTGLVQVLEVGSTGGSASIVDGDRDRQEAIAEEERRRHTSAVTAANAAIGPVCAICRANRSPYTCPQCNIPYCSLSCFRSTKHDACAQPFAKQTLRSELGASGEAAHADAEERNKMMDVLRRMQQMNAAHSFKDQHEADDGQTSADELEANQDDDGEHGWQDVERQALRAGVDLDDATTEELLALLSAEDRKRFEALIRNSATGDDVSAHPALERLLRGQAVAGGDGTKASWWSKGDVSRKAAIPRITQDFASAVEKVKQTVQLEQGASLEWNVITVLLSYIYILLYLDVENLQELNARKDVCQLAVRLINRLVPYLVADPRKTSDEVSRTILSSAEEVTLWLVARLGQDVGKEPAATISFLYKEALCILKRPRITSISAAESQSSADGVQNAICDLQSILTRVPQRKAVFYAAFWDRLSGSSRYNHIIDALEAEVERLQAEITRTEDEERWLAAHEAVQQQDHIVFPP